MSPISYEKILRDTIYPDLEKGRITFDLPHTRAVVYYIKQIIKHSTNLKLDKPVLITAAHAHDWGYSGLLKKGKLAQYKEIADVKELHMQIGANKLQILLKNSAFNFLSSKQKERAVHLVRLHDNLIKIKSTDEIILMEADTLGILDINKVKPTFDRKSNNKYMQHTRKTRSCKFITSYGKKMYEKLYKLRERYYEDNF